MNRGFPSSNAKPSDVERRLLLASSLSASRIYRGFAPVPPVTCRRNHRRHTDIIHNREERNRLMQLLKKDQIAINNFIYH